MLSLDVGCGADPKGDVNIDAFPKDRKQDHREWNPKDVKNFIVADGHKLPFLDGVFDVVYSSHTLEHTHTPFSVLKEMYRVSKDKVVLKIPSEMDTDQTKTHLFTWNCLTFKNLLSMLFDDVEVGYTNRRCRNIVRGKIGKYLHTDILLSKLGFRSEIYAICKVK